MKTGEDTGRESPKRESRVCSPFEFGVTMLCGMKKSELPDSAFSRPETGFWGYARKYLGDRAFQKSMFTIAGPICLHMLLVNGLTLADTMMIGRLGETAVAAVGLGNQMFFLVFLAFFGITSGTGIFVAQFWGDRDREGIRQVMGLSLLGILIFAVPFAALSMLFPEFLMGLFTPDKRVVQLGAAYLRIIAPSYIFSGIAFAFAMALRSVEETMLPLLATAVSMVLNIFLNLVLIFGLWGFPAMGVRGAALATGISRAAELVVIVGIVFRRRLPVAASPGEYLGFGRELVGRFTVTALPVLLNEVAWALGMMVYKMVFARMGTEVIAAANLTEAIQGLFFVVLIGSGNTTAIMTGKKIGEGRIEEAELYARYFIVQAIFAGIAMGLLMALTAPVLVLFLKMEAATVRLVRITLMCLGLIIPLKSFNLHMIVGVLRSGGDTRFSFAAEVAGVWFVGVPLALTGGLVLHQPLFIVYLMVGIEEVLKLVVTARRLVSGKWINNLTRRRPVPAEIPPVSDPAGS